MFRIGLLLDLNCSYALAVIRKNEVDSVIFELGLLIENLEVMNCDA